jgi:hypothetical protein
LFSIPLTLYAYAAMNIYPRAGRNDNSPAQELTIIRDFRWPT